MSQVTAIYFIPAGPSAPALSSLVDRFIRAYDPIPSGPFQLHHRLFRSMPTSTTDKSPPALQHVLFLGHYSESAFVHIVGPDSVPNGGQADSTDPNGTIIAIPPAQMELYSNLLNLKFGALWMYRMGSQLSGGTSYTAGDFTVRIGDLREMRGQMLTRGTIVCIQSAGKPKEDATIKTESAGDGQPDLQAKQAAIREIWSKFAVPGAKEVMTARETSNRENSSFDEVRLWCEVLHLQK
ncbi:mediator complex, subunit Med20 [Phyllosticta citrichinensis]|uniref:Mediator of RNA polymerase II transcription subunit 20 n=1 Tax=Phyllosticta citrichinensis TaxID=1130410 RepID=A0ABR1XKE0_9PEZI